MLAVLPGFKKPKPDYTAIYGRTYLLKMKEFANNPNDKQLLKQIIFHGVKFVNLTKSSDAVMKFHNISFIKECISQLTPSELLTIFPLDKTYDGDRYECKDYFYSINKLREIGMDTQIGDEVTELLWDYMNFNLRMFTVASLSVIDAMRRSKGEKGILEEFADQQGFPLTTYTLQKDNKGRELMVNNDTGETFKVSKKRPKHLKIVQARKEPQPYYPPQ